MAERHSPALQSSNEIEYAVHLVERGQVIDQTSLQAYAVGFEAKLMSGRALLSKDEEQRLMRRIDFRLMSLLTCIPMVKNLDANNVSATNLKRGIYFVQLLTFYVDRERSYYEQRYRSHHFKPAQNDTECVQFWSV